MVERDGGAAAFPSEHWTPSGGGGSYRTDNPGMSLRDWFAGQALAGFMMNHAMRFKEQDDAEYCYRVADAMLAVRKGERG